MIALGLYLSAYQYALPSITVEYGLDSFTSGLIVSAHFVAAFIFPFFIGALADKKGRKPVLMLCFGILLFGVFCVMTINNAFMMVFSIFIIGGSFSVIEGSMSSLLSEVNPGEEGKVMNISQMYFCAGAVAGPILGMLLENLTSNWRGVYTIVLVTFAVCIAWLGTAVLPNAAVEKNEEGSTIGKIIRNKYFILLLIGMFLYVAIEEGTAFWTSEYVDVTLSTAIPSAFFLSIYWLGMGLARLIVSYYKGNIAKLSAIMLASSVLFFLLILFSTGSVPVLLGFFLVGFGFAPVWPLIMTLSTTSFPDMPDTAAGGVMSAGSVGAAIAPMILGGFTEMFSIKAAFVVLFIFLALLFVVQMMLMRKKH